MAETQLSIRTLKERPEPSLTIRPFKERADLADVFRVHFSSKGLQKYHLDVGTHFFLETFNGSNVSVAAIAWKSTQQLDASVAQISETLLRSYGLKLSDRYDVRLETTAPQTSTSIILSEHPEEGVEPLSDDQLRKEQEPWVAALMSQFLRKAQHVAVGLEYRVKRTDLSGINTRQFKVKRISPSLFPSPLYLITSSSKVQFEQTRNMDSDTVCLHDYLFNIGGLHEEKATINAAFSNFVRQTSPNAAPRAKRSCKGLLLYGPRGTGKTLLQSAIIDYYSSSRFCPATLYSLFKDPFAELEKCFEEIEIEGGGIIAIDSIDDWIALDGLASVKLLGIFERYRQARILVIAATSDRQRVYKRILDSRFFGRQIEFNPPDASARAEILKIDVGVPKDDADPLCDGVAKKALGYVGSDLSLLVSYALELTGGDCELGPQHFEAAFRKIRPSAMEHVQLEVPNVKWTDIGGQDEVKDSLIEAIQWPLQYPELYGSGRQDKGILLYGPPGCSKTMMAKAIATETRMNFLAVKGAEILSKYVGDSERNLRDIFNKARAAAPSILFFDEIDAIARVSEGSNSDLNLASTILNEMDGIEELSGVFVLAATNWPEKIYPAILRPGRFDRHIYVGLPDQAARLKILTGELDAIDPVNLHEIAEQAEGFSGAEVVAICRTARQWIRRDIVRSGKADAGSGQAVVREEHLRKAIREVPRGVTKAMLEKYEEFRSRSAA